MKLERTIYVVLALLAALLLYSCANIGRPEGGPKDVYPPVFIKSTPEPNALNVKNDKVEITFDEIVQLKDQQTKVVISPVQKNMPSIKAFGNKVVVEFNDTLLPNTTYSIDFADAIQDNNEGNPLKNFAFAFSTGDEIDSLQISGMMLRARDLEPMQSIFVGLHSKNLDDSSFTKLPFERIARTDELGQFVLRNLKPGSYRIYGLKDMDGDYRFARSEDVAFYDSIIVPSSKPYETTDTVFKLNHEIDTIVPATHTMFLPNDVFLSMFNEQYRSLYLKKTDRQVENILHVLFSTSPDTLPELTIIKPATSNKNWYKLERTETQDSLFYWITDSAIIKSDSITATIRYLHTDSTEARTFKTDTIQFNLKPSYIRARAQKAKDEQKAREKEEKEKLKAQEEEKKNKERNKNNDKNDGNTLAANLGKNKLKKTEEKDSIPFIKIEVKSKGLVPEKPFLLHFDEPIDRIDSASVHLWQKGSKDTAFVHITDTIQLRPATEYSIMDYRIDYDWKTGVAYRFVIDSLSIHSIYDKPNKTFDNTYTVPELEEFGNLYFKVNSGDSAFVELLNQSDAVLDTARVVNGIATFEYLTAGTYYARIVIDRNGNGIWDTGNFAEHRQPEEVYYFPKRINLKKNWDVEETWNIYDVPIDKQKPFEIKKNRPKTTRGETRRTNDDDEDEEELFPSDNYSGNKYQDSRRNNANSLGNNAQRMGL